MAGLGVQLYTIRDECERDFAGAIARVGELGYEGVELFNLHGRDAGDVRDLLDEAGLAAAGMHAGLEALETELPRLVRRARRRSAPTGSSSRGSSRAKGRSTG